MKTTSIKFIVLIALTVSMAAISSHAQTRVGFKGKVPFDFVVSGRAFKAGGYTISVADVKSDNGALIITGDDGLGTMIVMATPTGTPWQNTSARLIFKRFAGQSYLSAIVSPIFEAAFRQDPARRESMRRSTQIETVSIVGRSR